MSTRGHSPNANPVGIQIVLRRVSTKPAHGSFTIFNLRRKRCRAAKAVINAGHGVSIRHQSDSWVFPFSASAPGAAMDPEDHWRWTRDLLWTKEVEREDCAVDGFVYQIPVNRGIGNLHHSLTQRRAGLRCRSIQRRDG